MKLITLEVGYCLLELYEPIFLKLEIALLCGMVPAKLFPTATIFAVTQVFCGLPLGRQQ